MNKAYIGQGGIFLSGCKLIQHKIEIPGFEVGGGYQRQGYATEYVQKSRLDI